MLLGNKCDIEAKRKVSKETGEKVRCHFGGFIVGIECVAMRFFKSPRSGVTGKCHLKQKGSGCLRKDGKCHVWVFSMRPCLL